LARIAQGAREIQRALKQVACVVVVTACESERSEIGEMNALTTAIAELMGDGEGFFKALAGALGVTLECIDPGEVAELKSFSATITELTGDAERGLEAAPSVIETTFTRVETGQVS